MSNYDDFDYKNLCMHNRNNDYEMNKTIRFDDFYITIDNVEHVFDGVAVFMDGNLIEVFVEFAGVMNELQDYDELPDIEEVSEYLLENKEFNDMIFDKL